MITGIGASIDGIPCLERFMIEESGTDNAVACSDSGGAVVRGPTNKDYSGVAVGYGYLPPKLPGTKFTFKGMDKTGKGWNSSANGAIVDAVHIFCNPSIAALFYYELYFSANGSLMPGSYTLGTPVIPNPASSKSRIIHRGSTVISDLLQWDLFLTCNTVDPVWTGGGAGWPNRDSGNIDAAIKWKQTFDNGSALPSIDDFEIYKLYVTNTLFFEIKWARVLKKPVEYIIRNNQNKTEYIAAEPSAHFSGYYNGAKGHILLPGGAFYWGA